MTDTTWARYNCIDAAVDYTIHREIMKDVVNQGYDQLYRDTMDLFPAIMYMQTMGLNLDTEALQKEKDKIDKKIEEVEEQLEELCGFPLNVNSPKQCQQYFYGVLGYAPYAGKAGGVTTDDTAMSRLMRKGCKEAGVVKTLRGLRKLRGTYLDVKIDPDGILRSSFNPRGTTTGRLSSSQTLFGTGLNFQNIDPRFKRFITAGPGRIFISMDKAQAEWIITAYTCGDPKMISAIENKEDIHARTIHEMTRVPLDLIKKDKELIGHQNDADEILRLRTEHLPELINGNWNFLPRGMSLRQCGKKTNHGCNYIEGYRMFALLNEIPETDAKIYVNSYRDTYIMLPVWWEHIGRQLAKDRTITTCFGHKRRFLGDLNHDLKKAAVSYIPQATSVWVVNKAMIAAYNDNSLEFEDLRLHAQVHDELLFSYPIDRWNDLAKVVYRLEDYMTPTLSHEGRKYKIGTDLAVGEYWAERDIECPKGVKAIPISRNKTELADMMEEAYKEAA